MSAKAKKPQSLSKRLSKAEYQEVVRRQIEAQRAGVEFDTEQLVSAVRGDQKAETRGREAGSSAEGPSKRATVTTLLVIALICLGLFHACSGGGGAKKPGTPAQSSAQSTNVVSHVYDAEVPYQSYITDVSVNDDNAQIYITTPNSPQSSICYAALDADGINSANVWNGNDLLQHCPALG